MIEEILGKSIQAEKVTLSKPKEMQITNVEDNEMKAYDILKPALNFIYDKLDLKLSTSKEVFKKNFELWSSLIQICKEKREESDKDQSNFNELRYIVNNGYNLVDIGEFSDQEELDKFNDKFDKFKMDITTQERYNKIFKEGHSDIIKLFFYRKTDMIFEEKYTPGILLEYSDVKASYIIYKGIFLNSPVRFIIDKDPIFCTDSYIDLIYNFDIEDFLSKSIDFSENLYNEYTRLRESANEISARELIAILKKAGFKLKLKSENELNDIDEIYDEENNKKITDFFNTFIDKTGESALDILSLSEIQKIFRFNNLTLVDVYDILANEYITTDGSKITASLLSSIYDKLLCKVNDRYETNKISKNK